MRQGQQNRRGRGRGGRKGQNPLSRSFESSGPDIKIRGTAQHIAEKYMALARDAIGSGDLVLGENYLQHAEHYNRIIMAAQTLPQGGYDQANGNGQRIARPEGDIAVDGDGYEGDDDGEGEQPGLNGGGYEQPRAFEQGAQGGQREQHNPHPQQHRNRDNRNFEHRNYDNRRNDQRSFEPRGQGGYSGQNGPDQRGGQETRFQEPRNQEPRFQDNRNQEPREPRFQEPRYQDQPRPVGGGQPVVANGDQPRSFEQPNTFSEPRDPRPAGEGRPADAAGPRGRRRRGRHENGANRVYPPQVGQMEGGESAPQPDAHPPERSEGGSGSNGDEGAI